ncbi:MAG: response regulator transcription factor [Candidatus Aminicenantales bacterium]
MKITIRVTNAYPRTHSRAALDVRPSPPDIPHPPAPPPSQKGTGGKNPSEAAVEATSIAVANELKRLRSIGDAASAAATEVPPFVDFGLEAEPGLSAVQTRFKILIVDDNPIIVRLLTHFLSKSNYEVKSVAEGMEGLKFAFAEKPDLILLDVMMPGMEGFRFLKLLKKGKRFANVPVLMIGALVEEDQVLRALEAGATDYIVKPFSSRIVLAKVHKALKDLL